MFLFYRVREKEQTSTTLRILIQPRFIASLFFYLLSSFSGFDSDIYWERCSCRYRYILSYIMYIIGISFFSMDLSMATTKPTLSGKERGSCPRVSSSSGLLKYLSLCHSLCYSSYVNGTDGMFVRFEMPYNIWCDGCKNHIGMG